MDRHFEWTRELLLEWEPPAHAVAKFMRLAVSRDFFGPYTDHGKVAWRRVMLRCVEMPPQENGLTLAQADRFLFWWTVPRPLYVTRLDDMNVAGSILNALERLVREPAQWFHPHGLASQMLWCNLLYGFDDIHMKGRPPELVDALDAAIVTTVRRVLQLDDPIAVESALHGLSVMGTDMAKSALREFAEKSDNEALVAFAAQGVDRSLCYAPKPFGDYGDWEELPEYSDI